MNNNELDNLVESFLSPKQQSNAMDLKELFALFDQMNLLNEQGFTSLSNIGMEKPLRGKEESYKTDFYTSLQAALGTKTSGGSASESLLEIINEINSLKDKSNWANYKLSQTISVITFIESLYNMIYNIQGDNPDVAGKMFERFIAFATNGRVSSQLALIDPETAKQVGATSTSIFDLITNNNEYVSVKLLAEFKITGSINNLYKYLFNVEESYTPIEVNNLQQLRTDKSITYLVTTKSKDREQLTFYSFIINCDNFVRLIGAKKIQDYNNSVTYKEKIEGLNNTIELLKKQSDELDAAITNPATENKEELYSELRQIRNQIDDYTSQREKITKGSTSFSIGINSITDQDKQNLWNTNLKVEVDEKDTIIQNSKSVFDGRMKRLIDEASAVYYKVSNLLLKIEDDNVGMQEKVAIGKEAYDSVSTLEKDILTVTKEYGLNIKEKPASKDNSSQTKLF